jgi:DNA-binding NtrC family response regulator
MTRKLLIADDSEQTRENLRTLLEADGSFQVDTTGDGRTALELLTREHYSIFLSDLRMPGLDGMALVEQVRARQIPVTVIVVTGHGSIDQAVKAIRLGAYDFLQKPINVDQLRLILDRAARERALEDEVAQLREHLRRQYEFQGVISKSPKMHAVFELIQNVAATTATVLIEGENGTGKERIARAIHEVSRPYRRGDFVAVNCAAVPESLYESDLFGHEKGSFTGADRQRKGRFEQANGGTLFLDEVGDIPPAMQVKLLRVLQERCFERVGGNSTIEVDVRVVAASNRGLARLVRKGKFREDLYYRLNVVRIELPPLRERQDDIMVLATNFAARYARTPGAPPGISPEAMEKLLQHTWPGNIRELENAIQRACVTARGPNIEAHDLPAEVLAPKTQAPTWKVDVRRKLPDLLREATAEMEKQYLIKVLRRTRGNVGRCAKISGLSRRSISSKLAEYQIDKERFKEREV